MTHKTKWKKVSAASTLPSNAVPVTAAHHNNHTTVLLQLHELYSQYIDICVIDSIANDCDYNIDMCVDLLNELTNTASIPNDSSNKLPNNLIDMTKLTIDDEQPNSSATQTTISSNNNALFFDDIPATLDTSSSEVDTVLFIKAMFDNVSSDTIQAVWVSTNHQLHDTIQILIAMTSIDTDDAASEASSDAEIDTYSQNPTLSHSTLAITNTLSKSINKHHKSRKVQLQPAVNNQWLNNKPTTFADQILRPDLSSAWKLDALQKAYPTIDTDDIESVFYINNYNFTKTMHALNEIYPNTCRDSTIDIQPNSDDEQSNTSAASTTGSNGHNTLHDIYTDTEYSELTKELSDWMNCNVSATTVYSDTASTARNAASIVTVQRQALFNAAATSYLHKKIVDAAQYSKKGQQYTNTVNQHNKTAMYATFLQYNYKTSIKKQQIDLHGLYAREVQFILPFILYHCKSNGNKHVDIITGAGNHSYNKKSRLKPIVVQLIQQLGYTYSIINDAIIKCKF